MAGICNVPATIANRAANFSPLKRLGVHVGDDTSDDDNPVHYRCDVSFWLKVSLTWGSYSRSLVSFYSTRSGVYCHSMECDG